VAGGLVAGFVLGFAVSTSHSPWLVRIPGIFNPIGVLFVNAIRVAVIPLVVSSLIVGVGGGDDDVRNIRRLGGRALVLILSVLLVAALFALAVTSPLIARLNVDTSILAGMKESAAADQVAQTAPPSLAQWLSDLVPVNVFKAAADGALMPLMVVSIALGLALTQVDRERRATVLHFFRGIGDAFLVLVSYIVKLAPIGVFALAAPLAARMGAAATGLLVSYIGILSAAIAAFTVLILYPAARLWGGVPLPRFAKAAATAQAVAFSSRSSLASLPAVYAGARDGLALPEHICNLFLPLAASMFRVGAAMVQVVGVVFLAKIYGMMLDPWQLATVTVMAVATSLAAPGIPLGGGILVMAPVLTAVHLPAAGIGILLGVDTIPDMFRTTANVTGWLCVASILSRSVAVTPKVAARSAASIHGT
jgi:Na+/H+-dicarboxylate symporter